MKSIKVSNIDICYGEIETKFINQLYNYDCLYEDMGKDAHIILTKLLVKNVLRKLNRSELEMSIDINGYNIKVLPDRNRPYMLFYFDKNQIDNTKEILEYISLESFIKLFEKSIQVVNYITNYRILYMEFPYKYFNEVEIEEISENDVRSSIIKTEIFEQKYSRNITPLKNIKDRCKNYSISLTKIQEQKVIL